MNVDTLSSYVLLHDKDIKLENGRSYYLSSQPFLVTAGATSIIHISSTTTGFTRTVIGSFVNNIRHNHDIRPDRSRIGWDSVPPLDNDIGRDIPEGLDINMIEDLRFRGPLSVEEITIPPGSYELFVIVILPNPIFQQYCENDLHGTNEQMCGRVGRIKSKVEEIMNEQLMQWYLFHISVSLIFHIILLLLILILILHWTGSL